MNYDISHDNAFAATMHAPNHVTGVQGIKSNYTFGIPIPYLPVHCATHTGLWWQLRSIYIQDFYHWASFIRYMTLWSWPFDLGEWLYMASHMFNSSNKFEYLRPICYWADVSYCLPLTMYLHPLRMHQIMWGWFKNNYIFGFLNHNLPIHYVTYMNYDDDQGPFTL